VRRRDRISLAISGSALLASVLLIGGALRWTQALVAGLVAAGLSVQLFARRQLTRISPLRALLGVAIALTAIQLIPLPAGLVAALDPVHAALRTDGAALAGTSPWSCLSMDPAGTLRALAFFCTLLGVATLSLRFASSERGRYYVLAGVALTCGIAAAVTGLHRLLGATWLYGVYEPQHAVPPILGPLLNPNHLGCLMALGAILAIGLTFYEAQASQMRVLWFVVALGCTLVVFGSLSRGAFIGLGIGVACMIAMIAGSRLAARGETSQQRRNALSRDIPIAIVVAVGLAVAVYTTAGNVADQIDNTALSDVNHPLSKFGAWKSSMELVADSPWVGVGRGAVEPTLTRVHPASAYATFSHLENEYVSAIVEWGIPGAFVLALALAWCMIAGIRRWRDGPLAAAALGGMAAVMFQSSVDFGVQVLGLAVPATAVAATVLIVPYRETDSIRRARLQRLLLIGAIVLTGLLVLTPHARSLQEDHDAVTDDMRVSDLDDMITRHPLDYFGFAKRAELLLRANDRGAVKYLNHALRLHPFHPDLHRLAARVLLASHRRAQAALEYSLALRGELSPKPLLGEILTLLPSPDEAAAAIPADWEPRQAIINALTEAKRPDVEIAWLRRMVARPQVDTEYIDLLYTLAIDHENVDAAEYAATRRLETAHTNESRLMLAKIEFRKNEIDKVIAGLADVASWNGRMDEQSEAWLLYCDARALTGATADALQCMHQLEGSGKLVATLRGEVTSHMKDLEMKRAAEVKLEALKSADGLDLITPHAGSGASMSTGIDNPLHASPLAPKK
jgi:O-antigen ligase